ncbi:hypothetical protein OUZ56_000318 [Daphnia magna]|uniref:CENP-V/GFA domain-containing protein n=1 Tax=Daphnia magna TaxID=35525 RepID=A0ABQ9ZZB3_9CRUS|nr:hypothetical protein OUZ56_000318 [Daphnia magna]
MSSTNIIHYGGCHCGQIRFKVIAPSAVIVFDCNCSICTKKQNRHFIVPSTDFTLLQGKNHLTTYTFGTNQAKHQFCKTCGVQSFYIPRSNPDGIGVMPHCIDQGTVQEVITKTFNGQQWEESMGKFPEIKKFSQHPSTSDME